MEIFSSKQPTLLLLPLLLLLTATVTTADLTSQELDAALFALRSNGYTLFPNAITTSDLQLRLLSSRNSSFTLFSPSNSLLFSLDLHSSARIYTFYLFLHASPHLLSTSDLLSLPRSCIETLLPNRQLFVERTQVSHNGSVMPSVAVNGVRVSVPDLFLGSNIAVHGLDGILGSKYRARVDDGTSAELGPPMAPKSWSEPFISPANPPKSLPPMKSRVPEVHGESDQDDDRHTNKGSRHGAFFRYKHLFVR